MKGFRGALIQTHRPWSVSMVLLGVLFWFSMPVKSEAASSKCVNMVGIEEVVRWYRCTLGGSPCGRVRETTETDAEGGTRSTTDLEMRFFRENTETRTRIVTRIDVGPEGDLREMMLRQELGGPAVTTRWTFSNGSVTERRSQGDRMIESILPWPAGEWHHPEAAFEIARRTATATNGCRLWVIDPARGIEPMEIEYRRIGRVEIETPKGLREGERWQVIGIDGDESTEIFDQQGRLLRSEVVMGVGLGTLRMEATTSKDAAKALEGRMELLEAGLVRPRFVGSPRRLDRGGVVVYRVRPKHGASIKLPAIGGQRLHPRGEHENLEVEVDPERGSAVNPDLNRSVHLAATAILDSEDPEVLRFARNADRPGRSDLARARALRSAVHRHVVRKDLATAFATAGETVRSRSGDCSEHAVLLAAALRAVGIPSRMVNGLVWISRRNEPAGVFLWHMWTQAVIDGEWVDLDATLGGARAFHPGHLAVSVADGSQASMEAGGRAMLEIFGGIEIEVLPSGTDLSSENRE